MFEKTSFLCYKELKPTNGSREASHRNGTAGTVLEEKESTAIEETYRSICLIQTCEVANGGTNRITFRKL
uniref:Uncharacterized protein n=1 Tax=Anopheles farauti TaxID=69004 RepID=A0A182Q628_9DIPT